jgi:hypothetical protein
MRLISNCCPRYFSSGMHAHFCFFRAMSENACQHLPKNCTRAAAPSAIPSDAQRQKSNCSAPDGRTICTWRRRKNLELCPCHTLLNTEFAAGSLSVALSCRGDLWRCFVALIRRTAARVAIPPVPFYYLAQYARCFRLGPRLQTGETNSPRPGYYLWVARSSFAVTRRGEGRGQGSGGDP